jgi:hypothetical protein
MKKKFALLFIITFSALLFLCAGALIAADDSDEPPEEIVIDNEGYRQDRKGPVNFAHLSHAEDYDAACTACHHDYEDGKNVWEEGDPVNKCSECHDPLESDGNIKKLMIAYHRNCIACHKQLAKEGTSEDAPYKKCYECHEKKEK